MGTSGKDIPFETQFLIVEANEGDGVGESAVYTVFLPIIEGDFRAVLQGNSDNELEICLESGMPQLYCSIWQKDTHLSIILVPK